jgi:AcrR family transcriptional regulator
MPDPTSTREKPLQAMAAHELRNGLNAASLRPLARAAGTSDRMLIYHFGSKDALIAALLTDLGELFQRVLNRHLPAGRLASDRAGVRAILELMQSDATRGFQRVWFDLLAASARGHGAHRATGAAILCGLHDWLVQHPPEATPGTPGRAADLLIRIEGILVAAELGLDDLVTAAIAGIDDGTAPD